MDSANNEQQLKEKALLLVRQERELYALRMKHEQVVSWLKLAQSLPQLVDPALPLPEICRLLGRALTSGLRVQRVGFFQREGSALVPLSKKGASAPQPLSADALALVDSSVTGMCNEPTDPGSSSLAEATRLWRFLWTTIQLGGEPPLLLVAGFDRARSVFQSPYDSANAAQMASLGQHIETTLRNALLVNELEREKQHLQDFNETLERRVSERTQELGSALAALEEKNARIDDDMRQACSFQRGILPALGGETGVAFEAVYLPLDLVGGDIYDVSEVAPRKYRVFIADATGHGVQASLRTIMLKGEYDRLKAEPATPDQLLEALNGRLARAYPDGDMLSTACCYDIDLSDPERNLLRYSDAAHPSLLLLSGGAITPVACHGPFLAIQSVEGFPLVEIAIEPGDIVFGYSDGLSDQMGTTRRGFDLSGALASGSLASLRGLLDHALESFHAFRGAVPVSDDITMVAARVGAAPR